MKRRFLILLITAVLISTMSTELKSEESDKQMTTRRFTFVVGANLGGADRVTLRYALDDARAIRNVLEDMGGVSSGDSHFLEQPSRISFLEGIRRLGEEIDSAKEAFKRVEVIFYYSGHSDEESILLDGDRISYKELKQSITALNADVRIAILDSCASGAFVLPKGVIKKSPFLVNSAYNMKGSAFMTSSSATEAAQESGRLKGSFFTHYLISGMRGAADMNLDGRITLNEAYQFAFDETLTQTEKTMKGPQHPNYNIQMSGTGDVVITEIWQSSAVLVLDRNISGKVFIHDQRDKLVLEMSKPYGRDISIGLKAGKYHIIILDDGTIYEASAVLKTGKSTGLRRSHFDKLDKIPTTTKGNEYLDTYNVRKKVRRGRRWKVDLFWGLASMEPRDLNLRSELQNKYERFYYDEYFLHKRNSGEITFYTRNNEGGSVKPLEYTTPFGLRLRYSFNNWLSVSAGFSHFSSAQKSDFTNHYTVIEASGRQYIYSNRFHEYSLSAEGTIPSVGVHIGTDIGRSMRFETFLLAGPLFAECSYLYNNERTPFSDLKVPLERGKQGFLEEEGAGIGWSLNLGARVDLNLGRRFGLFSALGYAHQQVDNIKGPGTSANHIESKSWDGDWGIKEDLRLEEWGGVNLQWPSNYWLEDDQKLRIRDFRLDLSGFSLKLGFFFRF